MAPSKDDSAGSGRPGSRRSLAHVPHRDIASSTDKENLTTDFSAIQNQKNSSKGNTGRDKKLRSKSLGPGGVDALQNSSGNRRKVRFLCGPDIQNDPLMLGTV
jgi:kinetochore protein Spc7/SPC105